MGPPPRPREAQGQECPPLAAPNPAVAPKVGGIRSARRLRVERLRGTRNTALHRASQTHRFAARRRASLSAPPFADGASCSEDPGAVPSYAPAPSPAHRVPASGSRSCGSRIPSLPTPIIIPGDCGPISPSRSGMPAMPRQGARAGKSENSKAVGRSLLRGRDSLCARIRRHSLSTLHGASGAAARLPGEAAPCVPLATGQALLLCPTLSLRAPPPRLRQRDSRHGVHAAGQTGEWIQPGRCAWQGIRSLPHTHPTRSRPHPRSRAPGAEVPVTRPRLVASPVQAATHYACPLLL